LPAGWAQRQPFSPPDIWLWRTADDPEISPDGALVVYTESWNDRGRGAAFTNLWLAASDGREERQLTEGEWRDASPRWSPDGTRIAYLSTRAGKPGIWVRSLNHGGDREVTRGAAAPLSLAWSPDGKSIAFTARAAAANAAASWAPAEVLPLLWPRPLGPVQVFVAPADGGEALRVSTEDLDFSGEPAWMPDGLSILCAAAGQIFSIRTIDHAVRELTREDSIAGGPVPSPDGGKIAFLARDARPRSYAVRKLFVMSPDGGRVRALAGALGRDAMHPRWSNDSRTVYFTADDRGATHVYAARNDGTARQVTNRAERLRGFSLAANGRAAAVRSSATEGGAVIAFAVDLPAGVATVAAPNQHLLAERAMGAVEEIQYPSAGKRIQAWLVKPPGFDAARRYPLLLEVQDAPRRMYGAEFQLQAQIFAAAGYVVLCANPRGTPGYGEEFGNLLPTGFPEDAADDLLRGVEYVAANPFVQPGKIGVIGGVTAAWLLGHSTRFSAAVLRRAVADWTADVALAPHGAQRAAAWMGAMPWENPDQYMKHSPIFFAGAFQTPALVIAGANDIESEELYFALQQKKVASALVRLSGDGPAERVLEMEAELAWLRR